MTATRIELEDFLKPAASLHADFDAAADAPDIEAIEAEAYGRGREAGLREAREERRTGTIEATKELIRGVEATLDERLAAQERARLGYLEQIFRTLLPSMAEMAFPREAAALVEEVVSELTATGRDAPFLKLHVPPASYDDVVSMIEDAQAAGYLACFADPSVAEGAAEIVWPDGGANLDAASVIDAVQNALTAALHAADSEPSNDE